MTLTPKTKKIIKMTFAIALPIAFFFSLLPIMEAVESSYLEFSYYSHRSEKTTPTEGLHNILPDEYCKNELIEQSDHRLAVFPDLIASGSVSAAFFMDPLYLDCKYRRGQFFLEWTMDPDSYSAEITRIALAEGGNPNRHPLRTENLFDKRAYVAVYNEKSEFEYAIVDDGSCTIRYIWFFDVQNIDALLFSSDWAPKKLIKDSDLPHSRLTSSYSMYWLNN